MNKKEIKNNIKEIKKHTNKYLNNKIYSKNIKYNNNKKILKKNLNQK